MFMITDKEQFLKMIKPKFYQAKHILMLRRLKNQNFFTKKETIGLPFII